MQIIYKKYQFKLPVFDGCQNLNQPIASPSRVAKSGSFNSGLSNHVNMK